MTVSIALYPQGTRITVRRGPWPLDPRVVGRSGLVVDATERRPYSYGVVLEGEEETRYFRPEELSVREALELPPEREAAKRRRALP